MASLKGTISGGHPFNSTLETGIRALVLLEALHPRCCDLLEMTWLDHLVVHTGDLDGQDVPASLHPDLPNSTGELLVRRQLVERSLRMMQQVHLVQVQTPYSLELKQRARWIANRFAGLETAEMRTLIEGRIGRWTAEFRTDETSTGLLK